MATEILLNDGGAPARILPFIAGEAISAGDALSIDTSGEVVQADSGLAAGHREYMIGVSLTDTASGDVCNVVSGKGIVCNVNTADLTAGKGLKVGSTAGQLAAATAFTENVCAVCLEDTSAAGLHRVLLIGG